MSLCVSSEYLSPASPALLKAFWCLFGLQWFSKQASFAEVEAISARSTLTVCVFGVEQLLDHGDDFEVARFINLIWRVCLFLAHLHVSFDGEGSVFERRSWRRLRLIYYL